MEHHVYFWLKGERRNAADRATFEKGLASLFEISLVGGGRWSVPADVPIRPVVDQTWDYAISMQFVNLDDHNAYQVDPDHEKFIHAFKEWWEKVVVHDLA